MAIQVNETYEIKLHIANARIPKTQGTKWPMTIYAQRSSLYDSAQSGVVVVIDSQSWDYTVTGQEKAARSTSSWREIADLERTLKIKVYEDPDGTTPFPTEAGTIFFGQYEWDNYFDVGSLIDLWLDGTSPAAWSSTRLRLPIKLICEIGQAEIEEPLKCQY